MLSELAPKIKTFKCEKGVARAMDFERPIMDYVVPTANAKIQVEGEMIWLGS